MRIAVFGAGGVGGYFGGRLAQAGQEVIFIARGAHLEAMRDVGLRVESLKGDFRVQPVQATDDPAQVGEVDIVLVAVKAWQVPEAAQLMRPMVGEQTCVLPLENGVEAPDQLAEVLGSPPVLGGLCHISAFVAAPGHIKHVGIEPHITLGELDGRRSQRTENLRLAFEQANIWAKVPEDIQVAMWEKFLFIAAISGVGAVTHAPAGIVRQIPGTRQLLEEAMHEILALSKARGVNLPDGVVAKTMAFIDNLPSSVTASMQRDIIAGKPSELESQNGAVVRMAGKVGLPTPVNTFLYYSLLPQEKRARGELQF
ncbi:MAG: 2-dehydropantoate 2-reductase [Anaerolineales bacterium]|nr:MAG: 2-dehydropantoate 2-reductase [Anaerolineales bacterium]